MPTTNYYLSFMPIKKNVLLIFSLSLFSIVAVKAQKPSASILMDCNEADKVAKVIFFRPFGIIGSAASFDLYLKDSLQTRIWDKSIYVVEVPAGKIRFTSSAGVLEVFNKKKNTLDLYAEAGKVYFVKCKVKSFSEGVTKPNLKLLFKVLNEEEISNSFKKYKFLRKRIQEKLYNDFYNQST